MDGLFRLSAADRHCRQYSPWVDARQPADYGFQHLRGQIFALFTGDARGTPSVLDIVTEVF